MLRLVCFARAHPSTHLFAHSLTHSIPSSWESECLDVSKRPGFVPQWIVGGRQETKKLEKTNRGFFLWWATAVCRPQRGISARERGLWACGKEGLTRVKISMGLIIKLGAGYFDKASFQSVGRFRYYTAPTHDKFFLLSERMEVNKHSFSFRGIEVWRCGGVLEIWRLISILLVFFLNFSLCHFVGARNAVPPVFFLCISCYFVSHLSIF